jgi:hypothetical protein
MLATLVRADNHRFAGKFRQNEIGIIHDFRFIARANFFPEISLTIRIRRGRPTMTVYHRPSSFAGPTPRSCRVMTKYKEKYFRVLITSSSRSVRPVQLHK